MKSDGQLYSRREENLPLSPPLMSDCEEKEDILPACKNSNIGQEELLLIGITLLLLSAKERADLPLVLAILYILFWK